MKVVVIGANGQLGSDVLDAFAVNGDEVVPLTHADVELTSIESLSACLCGQAVDVVVNTAARHDVESCEIEPHQAFAVNALGGRNLAIATGDVGATLIHISTDYVFDGKQTSPYTEDDPPLPLNVYGNSKLAGEFFIRAINPKHFILRTSALYGKAQCRGKKGGRTL